MKIFMISLLLIAMVYCGDEYEVCLDKYAKPRAKEVVDNIRNHQSSKNLDIIYLMCYQQFVCVFSEDLLSSIEQVKDYIYKDIFIKIFKETNENELSMIINYYWNFKSPSDTEKECYKLLGNDFDCKGLVDGFIDCWKRRYTKK